MRRLDCMLNFHLLSGVILMNKSNNARNMRHTKADHIISVIGHVIDLAPDNLDTMKKYRVEAMKSVAKQVGVRRHTVHKACTHELGFRGRGAIDNFDFELWNAVQGNFRPLRLRCINHMSTESDRERIHEFFCSKF